MKGPLSPPPWPDDPANAAADGAGQAQGNVSAATKGRHRCRVQTRKLRHFT